MSTTAPTSGPSTGPTAPVTINLWPGPAPLSQGDAPADVPTLTFFAPAMPPTPGTGPASGSCVLICPGGGYGHLAEHEGKTIGEYLASHGIAGAVLKYRLGPKYQHPAMLYDVSRGIRLLRHRAADLRVDPHRIAVMGFSAGGHLAATLSTHFDAGDAQAADAVDREPSRPDAAVLCYPVITMQGTPSHGGSKKNLLGETPDEKLVESLSNERQVTPETPTTFVFHTVDDPVVPIENALMYVEALRKNKVSFEAHLYEHGRHGVGLATDNPRLATWGPLMVSWLKSKGW